MVPPASQFVCWLPMLTAAANGTTETQRFCCVSLLPNRMFTRSVAEPTTDWIRLERRFPVTLVLQELSPDVVLHMGSDARAFIFY